MIGWKDPVQGCPTTIGKTTSGRVHQKLSTREGLPSESKYSTALGSLNLEFLYAYCVCIQVTALCPIGEFVAHAV